MDLETGKRIDRSDYPLTAVREVLLNALVHRGYSIHTEGMPIQLLLFEDRFEVRSPGGLYGRLRIDQLGKVQPDTRNPVLAVAMEVLGETENRYSGIPTMRRELNLAGMAEPEFREERGTFVVCFRKTQQAVSRRTPNLTRCMIMIPSRKTYCTSASFPIPVRKLLIFWASNLSPTPSKPM